MVCVVSTVMPHSGDPNSGWPRVPVVTPGKLQILLPQVSSDTAQDIVAAGGGTGNEYEENRMRRGSPAPGVSKILVQLQTDGIPLVTIALASNNSQTQRTGGSNNQSERLTPRKTEKENREKESKNQKRGQALLKLGTLRICSHSFSSMKKA